MPGRKIDTRAVLRGDERVGLVRRRQRERIEGYWPRYILELVINGELDPPAWRLLYDPTQWSDVPPRLVHSFVYTSVGHGRWPDLDSLRRRFGRVSNHRRGDENPLQPSLLDEQEDVCPNCDSKRFVRGTCGDCGYDVTKAAQPREAQAKDG